MIPEKTVLILGAGASMDFGFPSGGDLKDEIVKFNGYDQPYLPTLISAGFNPEAINKFSRALAYSLAPSVDRHLEFSVNQNPHDREIGCAIIAASLLWREEKPNNVKDHKWLETLFHALYPGFEEGLENDKLTIITYNYDCSIEYFLYNGLNSTLGQPRADETMRKIKIIHLHGRLAPSQKATEAHTLSVQSIKDSIVPEKGIRIIHEQQPEMNQFVKARLALRDAKRICFLGFGYDEVNLERLFLPKGNIGALASKEIFGSAFKRTHAENKNINNRFFDGRCHFGRTDWTIERFLRESGILFEYTETNL